MHSIMPGCCCFSDKGNEIPPSFTTIAGLDGAGQLLGLPGHQTSPPMDFFLWGHIKALIYTLPVDCEDDVIFCIVEAVVTIRQQQSTFESHVSLCCVVSYVSRSVAVHLNICSKLVRNTTSFQNTLVVLVDFQP